MPNGDLRRPFLRILAVQQLAMLTALAPVGYLVVLIMGLKGELAWRVTLINMSIVVPVFGATIPITLIYLGTRHALLRRESDKPGDRLERILKLPRRLEVGLFLTYTASSFSYTVWPTIVYGLSPWVIPHTMLAFLLLVLLIFVRQSLGIERVLLPYALEEFHAHPQLELRGRGFFWARQSWYLPYCFALFVTCTFVLNGTVVAKKAQVQLNDLFGGLSAVPLSGIEAYLRGRIDTLWESLVLPLSCIGGFMLITAAWSAWEIARHIKKGTQAVEQSIKSLASGKPALPRWVTTDEVGDLSRATAMAFEQLKQFSLSLRESAQMLGKSAEQLGASHLQQNQVLTVQAAALQETQVTAQEIKQTSLLASQKAEGVLKQVDQAEEIGRSGENAIEQSLSGLMDIQKQVTDMAQQIQSVDARARQIANITSTVKDLADQSNMLALNAAIEAVRSGEHGKGFGVVAREIRSLADQSIQATNHVREILEDLGEAITKASTMTERGSVKVQGSLEQVRAFGDKIRQLSSIVRDNAAAVRQISAAVTQQNTGISQIFQAVMDLSKMMDQTMTSLRNTDSAAALVRGVAEKVSGFMGDYGWSEPSSALSSMSSLYAASANSKPGPNNAKAPVSPTGGGPSSGASPSARISSEK